MNEIVVAAEAVLGQRQAHGLTRLEAEQLLAALRAAADPRPLLVESLLALPQVAMAKADAAPADWVFATFKAGLAAAWSGLSVEGRLATGLAPRWAALLGESGQLEELDALAAAFEPQLETPQGAALANSLLRQSRRQKHLPLALRMLQTLHPGWRPGRPWAAEYVQVLGFAARHELSLEDLRHLHASGQPLLEALSRPKLDEKLRELLLRSLPHLARRTLHLGAMRVLCKHLLAEGVVSEQLPALVAMLVLLLHFDHFPELGGWIQELARLHPQDAAVQWLRARCGVAQGEVSPQDLVAIFQPLLSQQHGLDNATRWLAATLFHRGAEDTALAWYREAASRAPLPSGHQRRRAQLTAKLEPEHPDAQPSHEPRDRLSLSDMPRWAEALRPLAGLMAQVPGADRSVTMGAAEAQAQAKAALEHFERSLPAVQVPSAEAALDVARWLVGVADGSYRPAVARAERDETAVGPAYGSADPRVHRLLLEVTYRHAVGVCEHALARQPLLDPGTPLRSVLELASLLVEHALLLGEVSRALHAVSGLRARISPLATDVLWQLEERCHLEQGDLAAAREAGRRGGHAETVQIHPVQSWKEWSAGAGQEWQQLVAEPGAEGSFEWVAEDGGIQREVRRLPSGELSAVHMSGLVLRNSFASFNASGALLSPRPWALASGEYPPRMPGLVHRARRAVVLEAPGGIELVEKPVVMLAEMDAVIHRHPFNWTVQILSRIEAARSAGLLDQRKLLVPSELSAWMRESLSAMGLGGNTLAYGREQALHLVDAMVVQPISHLAPALAQGLSRRLREEAKARGKLQFSGEGRLLFLSRRAASVRSLVDEEAIARLAVSMGFQVVQPEDLGALDLVALFASARGVAGAFGAAMTHILFAPPGARVLAMGRAEECPATYTDLAIARGQSWRWLLGASDLRFSALGSSRMPYRIDLDLAERELAWVKESTASTACERRS